MIRNAKISSKFLCVFSFIILIISFQHLHFTINPNLYLLLISALLINIGIVIIDKYSVYQYGKYFSLFLIFLFGIFYPNTVNSYFYVSTITAISISVINLSDKFIYITVSVVSYILVFLLNSILTFSSLSNFFNSLYSNIFPFLVTILIVSLFTLRAKGKKDINKLNRALESQNKKLQEYAAQIEDLTILNERNRIAQELHDSLGHYLMAISMHIDVLDKVKSSPEKSEEILGKTKVLVKDSIKELRTTVFELKEMKKSSILSESLNELIDNFSSLDNINFNLNIDKEIESYSPFIKDIIYKTVKEAITNGIKHGKASSFEISIQIKNGIEFYIKNNGISPTTIVKSNGLIGIEKRLELSRGTVEFISKDGFTIYCHIPNEI